MDIYEYSTKELKQQARTLYSMIYEVECYGTKDILQLQLIYKELEKRGVECVETTQLLFY